MTSLKMHIRGEDPAYTLCGLPICGRTTTLVAAEQSDVPALLFDGGRWSCGRCLISWEVHQPGVNSPTS